MYLYVSLSIYICVYYTHTCIWKERYIDIYIVYYIIHIILYTLYINKLIIYGILHIIYPIIVVVIIIIIPGTCWVLLCVTWYSEYILWINSLQSPKNTRGRFHCVWEQTRDLTSKSQTLSWGGLRGGADPPWAPQPDRPMPGNFTYPTSLNLPWERCSRCPFARAVNWGREWWKDLPWAASFRAQSAWLCASFSFPAVSFVSFRPSLLLQTRDTPRDISESPLHLLSAGEGREGEWWRSSSSFDTKIENHGAIPHSDWSLGIYPNSWLNLLINGNLLTIIGAEILSLFPRGRTQAWMCMQSVFKVSKVVARTKKSGDFT